MFVEWQNGTVFYCLKSRAFLPLLGFIWVILSLSLTFVHSYMSFSFCFALFGKSQINCEWMVSHVMKQKKHFNFWCFEAKRCIFSIKFSVSDGITYVVLIVVTKTVFTISNRHTGKQHSLRCNEKGNQKTTHTHTYIRRPVELKSKKERKNHAKAKQSKEKK